MLQKNRRRLERGAAKKAGRRYFVSLGRYRDATRHLAPGIWAASGPGGVDVRPVLMFVKAPTYRPRLDMQAIIKRSGSQEYLDRQSEYAIVFFYNPELLNFLSTKIVINGWTIWLKGEDL